MARLTTLMVYFDEEMGGPIRLTEFGYKVDCTAEGDLSIAKFDVWDTEVVGEIPILEPTPTPTPNPEPQLGIFPIDPSDIPSPGERHGYILYTAEPYYYVSWYVKAPWDTSELGEYIEGDNGDGTATTATMYYTYPSGAMHTGDFLITAVIYRWSDMSQYEETYVATVVLE